MPVTTAATRFKSRRADANTDARQKQHALTRRDHIERLLDRAAYLDPPDRTLLRQVFDQGVAPRDIALLTGRTTRQVQNRIHRLLRRLNHPDTLRVLRHHRDWPETTQRVAFALHLRGLPQREAARQLDLTYHQVRKQHQHLRGLLAALNE